MKQIPWITIRIGKHKVPVTFSTHTRTSKLRDEEGRKLLGVTMLGKHAEIVINALQPEEDYAETLVHELLHLSLVATDTPYWLQEALIESAEATLTSALIQCGLKLPPVPEAVAAMRRRKK